MADTTTPAYTYNDSLTEDWLRTTPRHQQLVMETLMDHCATRYRCSNASSTRGHIELSDAEREAGNAYEEAIQLLRNLIDCNPVEEDGGCFT
jgi:hypothetical protein